MNKDIKLSTAGKPVVLAFDDCLDVAFQLKKTEVKKNEQRKRKS